MTNNLSDRGKQAQAKARTLQEALPWITSMAGKTMVVKFGGNALEDAAKGLAQDLADDIALLHSVGVKIVLIHGGGPQISQLASKLGYEASFKDGQRITDEPMLEIVQMALAGQVNPLLTNLVSSSGVKAVGVSGIDSKLIVAEPTNFDTIGWVGEITTINPGLLFGLLENGFVPVVSTVSVTKDYHPINVNADIAAGHIASAIKADKFVSLTNVNGIYQNFGTTQEKLISKIAVDELETMMQTDQIGTGMIPKVKSIIHAVNHGVPHAHILDGRLQHSLLLEIFTDDGIGTMITKTKR